jgi:hypothetical protein
VFCSLDQLTTALEDWIRIWNDGAQPFTWTKTPPVAYGDDRFLPAGSRALAVSGVRADRRC